MENTVLIVDDSQFMRNLLRQIIEDEFEVVAEAENGARGVELYREHKPDLVLMDIVMPKCNGIKATAAIKRIDTNGQVVMCTSVGQREKMKLAVKAGAKGYVTKPFEEPNVINTLRKVASST